MNRLAPLLRAIVVLLMAAVCLPAAAKDQSAGLKCIYPAFLPGDDEGLRAIYEGIRLGLEKAQLPRVCIQVAAATPGAREAYDESLRDQATAAARAGTPPLVLFGLGLAAIQRLGSLEGLLQVAVVEQLAIAGRPADAKPAPTPSRTRAVVVAQVDAERVGAVWRRMTGVKAPRVHVHASIPQAERAAWHAFVVGAGAQLSTGSDAKADKPHLVLCPRRATDFADALRKARAWRVPLVSNDPVRFGQGATVVIGSHYAQVGRAAADAARRLITGADKHPVSKRLRGIRVFVDLEAADRGGVELPISFLASADRLRRGVRRRQVDDTK